MHEEDTACKLEWRGATGTGSMMLAEEAREAGREQLPKEMVVHCKDGAL